MHYCSAQDLRAQKIQGLENDRPPMGLRIFFLLDLSPLFNKEMYFPLFS